MRTFEQMGQGNNIVMLKSSETPEKQPVALVERDDDDLMLLARGGLAQAFEILIRRHQEQVLRLACKYTRQIDLAKDIGQNTFLEVYRFLPRYQARGRFRPFLYRIVLNQCRMHGRRSRYQQSAHDALAFVLPQEQAIPEESILSRERRGEVTKALSQLRPKLREVLLLRFSAGLSYQEIGETLKVPLGTVKSRLFEGLEKLRISLQGERP